MNLLDRIRNEIRQQGLLQAGDRLLVAVSGGADSMALLHALFDLRHEFGWEIIAAHYDHALRASSVRDQRFVRKAAGELGLSFLTERNSFKKTGKGSWEAFARECRYAFFRRAAVSCRADALVLAHTRDDVAETVLMRILRGAGLSGLRAIRPLRTEGTLRIVRPMLGVSRADVEEFLSNKKVRFVTDPTNRSLKLARNKVRLDLIPYLERSYAVDIKVRLASLAETVSADYDFLESEAVRIFDRIVRCRTGRAECPLQSYRRVPLALRRMILRSIVRGVKADAYAVLSADHIMNRDTVIFNGRNGVKVVLPGGLVLLKERSVFIVRSSKDLSKA